MEVSDVGGPGRPHWQPTWPSPRSLQCFCWAAIRAGTPLRQNASRRFEGLRDTITAQILCFGATPQSIIQSWMAVFRLPSLRTRPS
jgi:hypothetical protein